MRSQQAVLSAFKLQKSLSHPYALMRTARIGVVNRYQYVSWKVIEPVLTYVCLLTGLRMRR